MASSISIFIRRMGFTLIIVVLSGVALAQTTLERLEQQIRERVGQSRESNSAYRTPNSPSAQTPPLVPSPDNASDYGASMPVYLGLTAEDQADRGRGVRIAELQSGSPAEKAGLRKQDLIITLKGARVRQLSDMIGILKTCRPGDVVEFEVLRGNATQKIKVALAKPDDAILKSHTPETIPAPPGDLILLDPDSAKNTAPPPKPIPPPVQNFSPSEREIITQLQNRLAELERRVTELERAAGESQKNNK